MRKPTDKEINSLEMLIDQIGLAGLYHAISTIAFDKARHVEETYNDKTLGMEWRKIGREFDKLITKPRPEGF